MAFIGTPLDTRNTFQSLQGKRFNGDGSTTAFTLDVAPASTLDIEVFVGNVRQDPNSAYTLSGTTLTFTGAPPSGTNNIYVVHQAKSVGTIDPPATESTAKTFSGGLTSSGATTISGALVASSTVRVGSGTTSAQANGDDVVIEGSANTGLTILSGADDLAAVYLGQNGANNDCKFEYDNDTNALVVHTNATEAMKIDGNGHVTKPKQPFVYAFMDGDQTMTANDSDEKVELDAELFDVNADFNTSNNTFTAPVTGIYMVVAHWVITGDLNANITDMFFKLGASNGDEIVAVQNPQAVQVSTASAFTYIVHGSIPLQMDANDTLIMETDCFSGNGASHQFTLNGGSNARGDTTRMIIYLLG